MKYIVTLLALLAFPLSTNAVAGNCSDHTEESEKEKRVGA